MSMMEVLNASSQSVGRQTRGRTPIFRILLNGVELDVTVIESEITFGENLHDTGSMTVSSTERTHTDGILESPISFLFGVSPRTEVFCGYVTSVSEATNESGILTWTMGITGPTKFMQTGGPRFWVNRTIPSAVELLSYVSYLGYTGHPHTYVWPALAQSDGSDWRMVTSLAKRIGWSVFNRYGIVMLYDPLQLFKEQGVSATLISETYTLAKQSIDEERTLLEFTPSEDSETSVVQQGLKVAYFNDGTVQVAKQSGEHVHYRFMHDFVIRNREEAAIYVDSDASNASSWRQTAKARIMGNASLYPGMSVDIMTTNSKYKRSKFDGRWLIRGVQHKMDRQDYQSNLVLSRPDGTTPVLAGGYTPFWQTLTKSRPSLRLDIDQGAETPTEATKVWVSSWTDPNARSVVA